MAGFGSLHLASAETLNQDGQISATSTAPDGSEEDFPTTQELDEAFSAYATRENGRFNLGEAQADGVDERTLEVGRVYNLMLDHRSHCLTQEQLSTYPNNDSVPFIDWGGLGITERWNWCGRDRTDGGEPQNSADRVCMNHDLCLGKPNANVCACDQAFVDGMRAIKGNYRGVDRIYIEASIRAVPRFHDCKVN